MAQDAESGTRSESPATAPPDREARHVPAGLARYEAAVGLLAEGLWAFDLVSRRLDMSESALRIFGHGPEDAGMPVAEWKARVHPDDQAPIDAALRDALTSRDHRFLFECRVRHRDGTYLHVQCRGVVARDTKGRPVRIAGLVEDRTEESRRQEALDKILHHNTAILDAAGDGIFTFDEDGTVTYANPAAAQMLGYAPSALLGRPHASILHEAGACPGPDDATCPVLKTIDQERGLRLVDGTLVRRDGRGIPIDGSLAPLVERGRVVGAVLTCTDIRERKRAEEDARAHARHLARAQKVAHLGDWTWDVATDEVALSDEAHRVYGLAPEGFGGTFDAFLDLVHPEERVETRAAFERVLEGEDEFTIEGRIVQPDGGVRWIAHVGEVVRDDHGLPVMVLGTCQDTTEDREMRAELEKSERRLKEAQAVAHIGSWTWDMEEDRIDWSDELFRLYGLEPGSVAPDFETFIDLLHPDDREHVLSTVQTAAERMAPFAFDHRVVTPEGHVRWLSGRGRVESKGGRPVRMLGTAMDITDRRMAEERANAAREELMRTERLATLGTLVAGVAHELRTPMAYIGNNLNIIRTLARRHPDHGEKVTAFVAALERHADDGIEGLGRIDQILKELRAVYAPEIGADAPVVIDDHVKDALRLFRGAYHGPVEVETDLHAPGTMVRDTGQLAQVVINLVNNAVEMMPDGGVVHVRSRTEGAQVVIDVEDEGPGIDGKVRDRIFEPFVTTKSTGTGLGLFLVKSIVEQAGGQIEAGDREGDTGGARITVRLPRLDDD